MDLICETCHLPLRCEACGVAEADVASNYINDELQMVAIRVCRRCESIHSVAESDRMSTDGRAVQISEMTIRNMDAYLARENRRVSAASAKR